MATINAFRQLEVGLLEVGYTREQKEHYVRYERTKNDMVWLFERGHSVYAKAHTAAYELAHRLYGAPNTSLQSGEFMGWKGVSPCQ